MAAYFLDSSALVKRYVAEAGSGWIAGIFDPAADNRNHIVSIAGVEVTAALARRAAAGSLSRPAAAEAIEQFRADFGTSFHVVDVTLELILRAMNLAGRRALRGYDAVQLAAALLIGEEYTAAGIQCVLVSADNELNDAALAEGLRVENPNAHP